MQMDKDPIPNSIIDENLERSLESEWERERENEIERETERKREKFLDGVAVMIAVHGSGSGGSSKEIKRKTWKTAIILIYNNNKDFNTMHYTFEDLPMLSGFSFDLMLLLLLL